MEPRPPLVPRRFGLPDRERIDAPGEVLLPLDDASVARAIEALAASRIEAVAVGFLHSFTNPDHERRGGEAITPRVPAAAVALSRAVPPGSRPYHALSPPPPPSLLPPPLPPPPAEPPPLLPRRRPYS